MAGANDMSRGPWRLEITCDLRFTGPLHVGTGERLDARTDSPLLRDVNGDTWLPGSSTRGVIRDWCRREAPLLGVGPDGLNRLFGRTPGKAHKTTATNDRQGRLSVLDARLRGPGNGAGQAPIEDEVRDHVRINREYGAGARGGKFDQEVAHPAAATLTLIYEGYGPTDPEVRLLWSAVEALREGVIGFGAKRGWGFGAVEVTNTGWNAVARENPEELSRYLTYRLGGKRQPADVRELIEKTVREERSARNRREEEHAWSWIKLDVQLQFDGPMLVADFYRGNDPTCEEALVDATYRTGPDDQPYLPASSLRGSIRSHCERIAHSLDLIRPTSVQPAGATSLGPAQAIAEKLFGFVPDHRPNDGTEQNDQRKGQKQRKPKGRRSLLSVGEGRTVGEIHKVLLNHVAIDRVTGFAAEGKLFSAKALASPTFKTTMLVRWDPEDEEERAAVALLLFALRDARAGLLWAGSRTTRGYGHVSEVEVTKARLSRVEKAGELLFRQPAADLPIADFTDLETHLALEFQAWGKRALPAVEVA
jgi:CRISPR/Cas system CSM-associated protein Csm3 (group 7 of RAMP superfamily)